MGASKALAECAVEMAQRRFPRRGSWPFVSATCSALPQRRADLSPADRSRGPVTVTDERMTRFFMTIPEAVQLVIRSGSLGAGGELFVLDMGEPVSIMALARQMIELSGLAPERDHRDRHHRRSAG